MLIVLKNVYTSNVSVINIHQAITRAKSIKFFMGFNDILVVKTKRDSNIFFTLNLRYLSTMYLTLRVTFSVLALTIENIVYSSMDKGCLGNVRPNIHLGFTKTVST